MSPPSTLPPAPGLNVIALISGGKDSLYSLLHCMRNGHQVVALANLYPAPNNIRHPATRPDETSNTKNDDDKADEKDEEDEEEEDIDSFMYQTIGHSVIPLYESALEIPLYRAPITGGAVDTARIYRHDAADQAAESSTSTSTGTGLDADEDETEALVPLLRRIQKAHPEANAVSAGAILSTYQRTRIENVASRLGLVPLAWLWMYPSLPAPAERSNDDPSAVAEAGLLEDMAACGCDARVIKVASGGLDEAFLWENVSANTTAGGGLALRRRMLQTMGRFAAPEDIRGAVLGEGGEYETLAVDGPGFLWKKKIVVEAREPRSGEGGVAYMRLRRARCLPKVSEEEEKQQVFTPRDVRQPALLDASFATALEELVSSASSTQNIADPLANLRLSADSTESSEWPACKPSTRKSAMTWTVSNLAAPEAGPGAGQQMQAIATQIIEALTTYSRPSDAGPLSTDDIIFATLLLRSMDDFVLVNRVYVSLFKKPNPPARVTIACGDRLPSDVKVMVSLVVDDLGPRDQRQGLHVQSRSYWAPANIGPYSQAMSIPLHGDSRVVYIAGQIPLVPASMEVVGRELPWFEGYCHRAVLALQHLWRIGDAMQVGWWLGTVAFLAGEHADVMARSAWQLWANMHARSDDSDDEDSNDESPQLDAWDIKYGRRADELAPRAVASRLPKFAVFDITSAISVPPFLAVQVSELPKGSDIEWQGLGSRCDQARVDLDLPGGSISSTTDGRYSYTALEFDEKSEELEMSLQSVIQTHGGDSSLSQAVLYTTCPEPNGFWPGQVVPCLSVWGREGRRLTAAVMLHKMGSSWGPEEQAATPRSSTPASSEPIEDLRPLTRSPHPYHLRSRRLGSQTPPDSSDRLHPPSYYSSKSSRTPSDSGTEADDESTGILKGLPAPPLRLRKGLRLAGNGAVDVDPWFPTLQPWPSIVRSTPRGSRRSSAEEAEEEAVEARLKLNRKSRVEVLRRLLEAALLLSVGAVVVLRPDARSFAWAWRKELVAHGLLVIGLYAAYPVVLRVSRNRTWRIWPSKRPFFSIPARFDPAPLLYPIFIPVFVSLSLTQHYPPLILPNILLGLSSLPAPVIPLRDWVHGFSIPHWMVTLIPVLVSEHLSLDYILPKPLSLRGVDAETLLLLFPLHQALIPTLDFLLTTSVLPAELQLLTTALTNLYLFAASPQAEILKALLWLGGLCIFVSCRHIMRWEVALARIPSWKFRRAPNGSRSLRKFLNMIDHRLCQRLSGTRVSDEPTSDSDGPGGYSALKPRKTKTMRDLQDLDSPAEPVSAVGHVTTEEIFEQRIHTVQRRRHTISTFEEVIHEERVRTTPSGRRKKSMGPGLASFLSFTAAQAQVRKWVYALYVYAVSVAIILGPIRKYVAERALQGQDPFGWALGYLLGNLSAVRFWVLMMNLEYWIQLPPRADPDIPHASCWLGWVEHLRQATFGPANTRLLLSGYCVLVLLTGLAVVFQLSSIAEVDTRRKVFHGMMVLMFLPTVFVDPTFCALALALVLSIFLLLDLFRASQLPPISRPLTHFLAPYVDGRDHRGPVIISHIFLLIGCSIPLWLSLSDLPRSTEGPWADWDVPTRDVSMVSGVICVGMGDAAASLVGRRFGRLKWFWGGGKSLEGSVAFAAAVSCGLISVRAWLVLGGWSASGPGSAPASGFDAHFWLWTTCKAVLAAGGTSATEAILTGCNDNVVVPIVLWLLVRGLGV
ncbi:Phosphatidate cytidylyltransferase [Penicillium alfredii]|uniref:Diphthine--ammonia ligase n=1 Tax=Penicillium alfredii TaxID=1506179 RepID=A0A9W9K8G8_9EURO|nr:Phosphatidate cytidylyltransferase [Penicillium alfredii]KAJ5095942.1 Phosphatidate cytidylyltransferase [Penicillium alfredii]